MTVQSKLLDPLTVTCHEFHHPWTDKCANASAGILLAATPYCLRVYTVVYALSLIMRHRIPTYTDLKRTIMGILQSSAFLITNAYTFIFYNCLIRNLLGRYYFSTVAFWPCFLAAWTAIVVERPERRPLLTLYVANVATETLWKMAEARGFVRSLSHGQTIIFGLSISTLLYIFRLGLHKGKSKDSIFNIIRIFVGKEEEGPIKNKQSTADATAPHSTQSGGRPINFFTISGLVRTYSNLINGKHESCAHRQSCVNYVLWSGLRPFVGGVGLQVALKLIMNITKIARMRMEWKKQIFNRDTLKLGIFLGSFSFLYKSVSCVLRHSFGYDDARFAIPAGLVGSIAFTQYPDTTVALYVMWKALQIVYKIGIDLGVVPHVPHSTILLYSFFTAVLFHAGILEPKSLRPSYYKFLQAISGDRLTRFNVSAFDAFGVNTQQQVLDTIKTLKIVEKSKLPTFAFAT